MTSFKMDQEEIKTDAPVKPAKTRAPRKSSRSKAPAAAPEGDAGVPAASPAPEKVSKPRAPRRKKETPKEAPVAADAPSAPVVETPAPQETSRPERRQKKQLRLLLSLGRLQSRRLPHRVRKWIYLSPPQSSVSPTPCPDLPCLR